MSQTNHWPIRWDLLLRYRLIEIIALWEGRLTTNHLMSAFGIGRQQASKDINNYLNDFCPNNLIYDPQLKGYCPTPHFRPVFTQGNADEYLHMTHAGEDLACSFDALGVKSLNTEVLRPLARDLRPNVLRPILKACREQLRVEIQYTSLNNPEPEYRVIQPHTIIHNGFRWHVRAWCEQNLAFRDFVLSRIGDTPEITLSATHLKTQDTAWNTFVDIVVVPDPRLTEAQQKVIARDFAMGSAMSLTINCRGAMVTYKLQQLNINSNASLKPPLEQQIVLANWQQLAPWLF